MTDGSDAMTEGVSKKSEQELIKLFKRRFENSRELITHVNSVLKWEKPYHPAVIFTSVTLNFMVLWYFDPSILTFLSVVGICWCVFDYLMPILSQHIFSAHKWTGSEERKFEELCRELASASMQIQFFCNYIHHLKNSKPYLYFIGIVGTLIFTAWIGNLFDNFFLSYFLVLFGFLLPGIKAQGLVQTNISKVTEMISGLIGGQGSSDKKKK